MGRDRLPRGDSAVAVAHGPVRARRAAAGDPPRARDPRAGSAPAARSPPVDLAAANAEIDHLALPWKGERAEAALHALLHYDALVPAAIRRTRPLVTSTLDLDLQREVEGLAWRTVRDAADRGAGNAAVLVVDRERWEVVAAVSSTGYFDADRAGAIDYLRLERSPGSALKPFLFAQALERGTITPASVLDDLEPGPSGILNSDARFLGPMLPRVALANSRNVPAVALLARLGLDEALRLPRRARPPPPRTAGEALRPRSRDRLVAGHPGTARHRLHDARRRRHPARAALVRGPIRQDDPGTPFRVSPAGERLLSESTARLVTLFLADPQARLPTFPRMGFSEYPFAVAVKTGTSSRYRDAWTVAWSKRYLVGVWVGHPDERPMTALSGYRIAARLAQAVVERLHGEDMDGLAGLDFPPPRGYRSAKLCALSGQRATAACDRVVLEWLPGPGMGAATSPDSASARCTGGWRSTGGATASRRPRHRQSSSRSAPSSTCRRATPAGSPRRRPPSIREQRRAGHCTRQGTPFRVSPGTPPPPCRRSEITSPETGLRLLLDPETPPAQNTLALTAVVEPRVDQLVWYVDGRPFRTVDPPFDLRWPLVPGEHTFQARIPFTAARSRAVTVIVE